MLVNGDVLGPEGLALLGALVGVVLEADAVARLDGEAAQAALVGLVALPEGRDYGAALRWAGRGEGVSGGCITGLHASIRRRGAVGDESARIDR